MAQFAATKPRPSATQALPPIRVMICDDSAVIRAVLCRVLAHDTDIVVVARAANGQQALDQLRASPGLADILILDIEMPEMDGLTALPLLLQAAPRLRIIIASTLSTHGASTTLEAMRLGAHDYVPKPTATVVSGDASFQRELLVKIHALALRFTAPPGASASPLALRTTPIRSPILLAIGSSTGGPQALAAFLQALKTTLGQGGLTHPVVLTQHMPAAFTPLLAGQLTRLGGFPCIEAKHGAPLVPGHIHIAPGGRHLLIHRHACSGGATLVSSLDDGPPENFCRPSVDPMLRSAASACHGKVLMIMLTGMGHDGLEGTRTLVQAGGAALAQDEASSVVWGMPGAVARAGLCHALLPIQGLAERTARILQGAP